MGMFDYAEFPVACKGCGKIYYDGQTKDTDCNLWIFVIKSGLLFRKIKECSKEFDEAYTEFLNEKSDKFLELDTLPEENYKTKLDPFNYSGHMDVYIYCEDCKDEDGYKLCTCNRFVFSNGAFVGRKYIYADFGSGRIWSLEYDGVNPAVNTQLLDTNLLIASFGVDQYNELYICAFDGKIYRFTPTATGNDPEPSVRPQIFELGQNYPNPFNPTTEIPYRLQQAARVSIAIFDSNGKLVTTLVDSMVSAGAHTAVWDGTAADSRELSGGIYFYRLKVDNSVIQTRKMVLLK